MSAFRIECPKCGATWEMPDQYPVDDIEFCPECQTGFDPRNAPAPTQPVPVLDALRPKKQMVGMIAGGGIALLILIGVVIWLNVAGTDSDANVAKDDAAADAAVTNAATDTTKRDGNGIKSSASPTDAKIFGPTVPFAQQVSYAPSTGGLTYSWPEGVKQICNFEYEIEVGNVIHGISGRVDYEPTRTSPSSVITAAKPEGGDEGSGSAFVVRPDGYLVTCAHVVVGAVETTVQLRNRTYAAKVVDLDIPNDLALLRIAADKLPYLTIFDSDNVRLAEDVRAIGYPLSDVLGESITVSRGTVSAIVRQEGESLLQLDARVNPGNSGGPIVNEKGQLIGVASAMLAGEEIASIGFAVPSNKVRGLLEKQKLRYRMADPSTAALAGPDLAAQVTPAVALVKVRLGPGGVGIAEEKVIRFSGIWNGYLRSKTSTAKRAVGSARESGVMLVDSKGQVSYCDGTKSLPAFAGLVGLVGIIPLPDDGEVEWQSGRMQIVPQTKTTTEPGLSNPPGAYRSPNPNRYSRPGPATPPKTQKSLVLHPAIETAKYKITSTSGNILMITKSYELKTLHDAGEPVYFHSKGTGSIQFDKKRGIPLVQVYLGQLQLGPQGPLPVRMKLTYALSDGSAPPVVVKIPPPMVNPGVTPVPDKNPPPLKPRQLTARLVGSPKYFDGHSKPVWKTAYSPNGKLVASSGDDQSIRIWDIGEQHELHRIDGDGKLVGAMAISPDGKQLASGHYGEKVRLWDVESGKLLKAFTAENDRAMIGDLSYSPTGQRLVACSGHGTIAVFDVVEQSVVTQFDLGRLNVRAVGFLPDEKRILIAGTHPPFVELWNIEERKRIRSFTVDGASRSATSPVLAVRADGAEAAFSVSTSQIYRWNVETGEPLNSLPSGSSLHDLVYSPNTGYLVAHGTSGSRIFDIDLAQPVVSFPKFSRPISGLWLSADGQRIKLSGQSVRGGQQVLAITEFVLPADPSRQ